MPSTSQFDILSRWKNNQGKYLILAKIARDFLIIPVSIVASESAFSTRGRHLSSHRNRLHPSIVEVLVCTQNWFWLYQNLKGMENIFIRQNNLICYSIILSLTSCFVSYVYDLCTSFRWNSRGINTCCKTIG